MQGFFGYFYSRVHCSKEESGMSFEKYPYALKQNTILNGRYIIQDVLGQGGFGITYKALEYHTKKTIAVKEFYPNSIAVRQSGKNESNMVLPQSFQNQDDFEYGKAQFLKEAKTLSEFNGNATIVDVIRYFEENGTAYFVMEYVQGTNLRNHLLDRGGRISWEEAWTLLLPVMDALTEVHKKNIIHRDIKPDNILITEDGSAKLLDFGAARYNYGIQSQSLDLVLTRGFAPVEQYIRHGRQGPWTDVYALAATFYTCVTGRIPPESVERSFDDQLKAPHELGISIPSYAEAVLLKALAVQKEDRIQSMSEFKKSVLDGMRLEEERSRSGGPKGSKNHKAGAGKEKEKSPGGEGHRLSEAPWKNGRHFKISLKKSLPFIAAILAVVIIISRLIPWITGKDSDTAPDNILIETFPYAEPDPDEKASAYPWICSDIAENAVNLYRLSEKDDFHAAVNREWLSTNTIPSGYVMYDAISERDDQVKQELLGILESNVVYSSDAYIARCQKLVQDYYKMWLDWDTRDASGVEPLRTLTEPLVSVRTLGDLTAYITDFDVICQAHTLCAIGMDKAPDHKDSYAVYIEPAGFVLTADTVYYREAASDQWKNEPYYTNLAGYMLDRLGYTEEERNKILQDCFSFEKELSAFVKTSEEKSGSNRFSALNNPRTLKELKEEQGTFPLTDILKTLNLDTSSVFILEEPEWLAGLGKIYDESHLEKMKAYLLVRDVIWYMELLDHDCYNQFARVQNELGNTTGMKDDRNAACDAVNSCLGKELGCVYSEAYITAKVRADIRAMCDEITGSFRNILSSTDLFSAETKNRALDKLEKIQINIASPDDLTALSKSSEISFKGPEDGGNVFDARIAVSRSANLGYASKVNQKFDRSEWRTNPQESFCTLHFDSNSLTIPAGILGSPLYSDQMTREEKLGFLGSVISGMLSYEFIDSGRQFDEYGSLCNWWTQEDYDRYHTRAQKCVDYLSGFSPVGGVSLNGELLSESFIADLTGLKCLLNIADNEQGFDYDTFFRSYASANRMLTTERTESYWAGQGQFPSYLKTNAVLVHFERFHETFGTKDGDGMYLSPECRVEIW